MIGISYSLETLVVDLITYLRTVLVSVALTWLGYRTWQVITKPVDDLINLLGLEVPATPSVSLAGVKADGFILHWKVPHNRTSIVKYQLRLNGIAIGETSHNETSVSVTGLKPEHFYNVRVAAVNSSNFSSASCPIRVKTSSGDNGDRFESIEPDSDAAEIDKDGSDRPPKIKPYKLFQTASTPSPIAPSMTREHSGSQSHVRRMTATRRSSPATAMHEQPGSPTERRASYAGMETVQQLTERLEGLRRETDEVEKQLAEEEEDYNGQKQTLMADRDKVRQELKDKEDKSRDIKKEVNGLESQVVQAQNKQQAKEKILRQKQSERKRTEDDMARWSREIEENAEAVARMRDEERQVRAASEEKMTELQSQYDQEVANNKTVEDELHRTGLRVKDLEDQRKDEQDTGKEGDDGGQERRDAEEERHANESLNKLQSQYARAYAGVQQAKSMLAQSCQTLDFLQQAQPPQSHAFSPTPSLESVPLQNPSLRRRRAPNFRTLDSSPIAGFPATTGGSHSGSITSISPALTGPSWLSMNTLALSDSAPGSSLSRSDADQLTGGAPMSPTAHSLLPSGLLGDDLSEEGHDEGVADERASDDSNSGSQSRVGFNLGDRPLPGLNPGDRSSGAFSGPDYLSGGFPIPENWSANPSVDDKLPGLGAIQERRFSGFVAQTNRNVGADNPHSPGSASSRSPSAFASPRDSAPNLHQTASDSLMDSDRRSIRSTGSNRVTAGAHSRFHNFFHFARPRTNTNPESEGLPALGSLPPNQSQSLPRQDQSIADPSEVQLRGGSRSTHLLGHVSNVFGRSSARNTKENTGERWPYSFTSDDRTRSPRPISTHSSELPRPNDNALINAFNPMMARQSSPIYPDWLAMTSTHSFSRHPSRRASEQYSQSGGFPYGETLVESDPPDIPSEPVTPPQAPIGTKPSKRAQTTGRLNPAAKSFSIFSRDKKEEKGDKTEKTEKTKSRSKGKEKESAPAVEDEKDDPSTDDSPSDIRFSKDTPSLYTTDSQTDPGEPLEHPDSLTLSISHTASESHTPSSATKESKWHHKITRKGSTSSFPHLSSLTSKGSVKAKTSGFFSSRKNNDVPTTMSDSPAREEVEGDGQSAQSRSGDLLDDGRSRSSGLSWSSITKRMTRKGDKTPSIGDLSLASESLDDDAEDSQEA
ncbi:MAG: hypothetical protein Q9165_000507 [Trypethelium subeluteriae]